jgi:hypothetical protein
VKLYSVANLIKNDHFLLILGQKHDERRIFTLFLGFFWPDINT